MRVRRGPVLLVLLCALTVAACSSPTEPTPAQTSPSFPPTPGTSSPGPYAKVMVITEENQAYDDVMGSGRAPYLDRLAARYATATAMDAGYPVECPSLAAYLLMTGGDRYGICDNDDPSEHPIAGPSVFSRIAESGREWRQYSESMPANCTRTNSGHYLVRHAPPPYYDTERDRCLRWDVPLGSTTAGALHDDVAAGRLPAYSMVTPDECHDMHGGFGCDGDQITTGDAWLAEWMPQIIDGPDFRAGRLVVVITWDEGSGETNHIPTLVVAPTAAGVVVDRPMDHCALLRTELEVLGLDPLGCAAGAPDLREAFGLA